jgi:hypothetical protein
MTLSPDSPAAEARLPGGKAGSPADEAGIDKLTETVQRLCEEFPATSMDDVSARVAECRRDLSAVPPAAEPELVERLARVRLAMSTGYPGGHPS